MPNEFIIPGIVRTATNDNTNRLRSGLLIPGTATTPPSDGLVTTTQQSLQVATGADILQYGIPRQRERGRSSTDFALAFHRPAIFLAREAGRRLENPNSPQIREVIENLRLQGQDKKTAEDWKLGRESGVTTRNFDGTALNRQQRNRRFFNRQTGVMENQEVSAPGAVETVGLAVTELLSDPELRMDAGNIILRPLAGLIRDYRLNTGFRQTPEMPDLRQKLIEELDHLPTDRRARYGIYEVLNQMSMPLAVQEALVHVMDSHGDLEHPLAFQITVALGQREARYTHMRQSEWIRIQQERRQQLLDSLEQSNQEVFEQFPRLLELSKGLVYHDDPLHPRIGRVGMEIEFHPNPEYLNPTPRGRLESDMDSIGRNRIDEAAHDRGLDTREWRVGYDDKIREVRKTYSPASLDHNHRYMRSLTDLSLWIRDYGEAITSMHLHFDKGEHPIKPDLGHIIAGSATGRPTVHNATSHNTWEIRGIFPPRAEGTFHPARVEDVIGLYLSASTDFEHTPQREKLRINPDQDISVKQMTFGHIATFLNNPRGRLAALMVLHDTVALANVNPLAFAHSVAKEDLPYVIDRLGKQFKGSINASMIETLRAYSDGSLPDIWNNDEFRSAHVDLVRTILKSILPKQQVSPRPVDPAIYSGTERAILRQDSIPPTPTSTRITPSIIQYRLERHRQE